ncbi:hypothetical protein [Clostridium sp.]|uniref:hypothetical protein n=1 Tax=Clostridium sp. TaxID=1506 RepID=UPI002611EC38|nr:hypothetical protein [Clostridium sp.]
MNTKLMNKIIEISKENGSLKKENEILRKDNEILQGKINRQKELNDFVETFDQLLNINNKDIINKTKILEKEENPIAKDNSEPVKKVTIAEILKKNFFSKK